MNQFIRDYLTFNKRERNGIAILLLIILLLLLYLNISNKFTEYTTTDFTKFETQIASFDSALLAANTSIINTDSTPIPSTTVDNGTTAIPPEYFTFNPNNLSIQNWQRLGFTDKQIQTIKNYESKGGRFRTKEDVKKMYCITQEQYQQIEPYIQIPPKEYNNKYQTSTIQYPKSNIQRQPELIESPNPESESQNLRTQTSELYGERSRTIIVELNSADSAYLTKIKGIGAFYAKSIIKYRQQLGGFAFKEQLMEIWKFDKEKFDAVKHQIIVDESEVKKLNINTFTAAQLKHPYISWNMANAIENYRKHHGKYKTLEEIKNTDLVDDETFRKLVYYLTLE